MRSKILEQYAVAHDKASKRLVFVTKAALLSSLFGCIQIVCVWALHIDDGMWLDILPRCKVLQEHSSLTHHKQFAKSDNNDTSN